MSIYESSITNPKKQLEFYKDLSEQLQQENEKLNHYKLLYQKVKDRNDKAIEYIDDNVAVYAFNNKDLPHWEFNADDIEMLLEILKGNNEEVINGE
jgi:hypothetical protein